MDEVSWQRAGAVPWLVTTRPGSHPVAGGVSFQAGLLHQPADLLGVAGLLAAWLTTGLARPVAGGDRAGGDRAGADRAGGDRVRVGFSLGQTESALVVVGTAGSVSAALNRVAGLLDGAGEAVIDDGLRERSRSYRNPLEPWRTHLAARWPGHPPHLSALGPLALDCLDGSALGRYVAERAGRAARVYWTNDAAVIGLVTPSPPVGGPATAVPVPAGWPGGPACVVRRSPGELFTIAMPAGLITELALTLLLRHLRRRMVTVGALATGVRISRYEVAESTVLACAEADLLPGDEGAARAAAVEILAELAAGPAPADEFRRVRHWHANAGRTAPVAQPAAMAAIARRHLRDGSFPTPAGVAAAYELVGEERVRAALADSYRQLLLAVPAVPGILTGRAIPVSQASPVIPAGTAGQPPLPMAGQPPLPMAGQPPLPMAGQAAARRAEGRRFRERLSMHRMARCSTRRVSVVEAGRTTASVDFAEVVLRLDAGDQRTTLIDRQLGSVQLAWSAYRRGRQLRQLVDRHTPPVPVVRQRPDPEWPVRFAAALRRQRRQALLATAGLLSLLLAVSVVIAATT